MRFTRAQLGWILYDIANAAFALIVRTVFAPMFYKSSAATGLDPADATSYWGLVSSVAGLVAGVLAPWLGAIADANSGRKRCLAYFLAVGLLATVGLCFAGTGDAALVLTLYFVSLVAYMGSNSFYDSLLVDVSSRGGVHRLSSIAYAWGYIGGMIPFLGCLALMFLLGNGSIAGMKLSFVIAAVWWGALALPLFRYVRERPRPAGAVRLNAFDGFRRLVATAREIGRYRNVVLFLIAYFLYIDGVGTIYMMATPISKDIGISDTWLLGTILGLQLLAFPFTILYGRLARLFSARRLVCAAIVVYVVICVLVGIIPSLETVNEKLVVFLAAAFLIGSSQGGIQSLSRSLFSRLIPREHASEFFGFYNIFGKFTTVLGPVLIYLAVQLFGRSEYGIALLAVPFLLGGVLLCRVNFSASAGEEANR